MTKKAHFFIDDTIWVFRDLAKERPKSLFDNSFLKMLKEAHDRYGTKTQLNVFYRTDSFYGYEEFSLADMPDCYKSEWEACSEWLKLAFHAKEEFPDYPHVNARYEDVKALFKDIEREVIRFAGKNSFAYGVCPHWLPVSYEGVRALYDCGVTVMDVTSGETAEYNGDPSSLPYGHAMRLLNNRQPETKVFKRISRDVAIENSICAYNHVSGELGEELRKTLATKLDPKTGMRFKHLACTCLNLTPLDEIEAEYAPLVDQEYLGVGTHEQYFYKDYFAYQPEYAEKVFKMAEILERNGYEYIFAEDIVK